MQLLSIASAALTVSRHALRFTDAADREAFRALPHDEQARIRALHDAMVSIDGAKTVREGCRACARPRAGWSVVRLNTLHSEWRTADRHWRALLDTRRFPKAREAGVPEAMQAHIYAAFCSNQRSNGNAAAWRQIIRQWKQWLRTGDPRHALPGYPECPLPSLRNKEHPDGLSYKNALRYGPPPAELAIARIGVHAGMSILPHIPGDRTGARWLEWVSGDDVWLDRKCFVPGYGGCRVVQFGLMDYAASYYLPTFIQRPILPRTDGTDEQLKRRDFLFAVALMIETYGYPLDWKMHLILERGTATLSKAEARWLYEVTEGQIIACYSGMEGETVAWWDERRTGNSRAKGWQESFHHLFHNEQGHLPGQVGKDRQHSPAALHGSDRYAAALANAGALMSPAQRALLRVPYPHAAECYAQTLDVVHQINARPDHSCQGFETIFDWTPRGERVLPRPLADLPAWLEANPRVDPAEIEDHIEWHPRMESPRERAERLAHGARFGLIPPTVLRLFYESNHEQRRIAADGSFSFERDKRAFRFVPPTPAEALPVGEKVAGFFRPDASAIHLFAPNGKHLVTWPAEQRVRRDDRAALNAAMARKVNFRKEGIANVAAAKAHQIERARADAQHNDRVGFDAGLLVPHTRRSGERVWAVVEDRGTATAEAVQAVCPQPAAPAPAAPRRRASASAFMPTAPAAPAEKPATFTAEPTQPTRRTTVKASAFLP